MPSVRFDTLLGVDVVRNGQVEQRTGGNANHQFLFDGVRHGKLPTAPAEAQSQRGM